MLLRLYFNPFHASGPLSLNATTFFLLSKLLLTFQHLLVEGPLIPKPPSKTSNCAHSNAGCLWPLSPVPWECLWLVSPGAADSGAEGPGRSCLCQPTDRRCREGQTWGMGVRCPESGSRVWRSGPVVSLCQRSTDVLASVYIASICFGCHSAHSSVTAHVPGVLLCNHREHPEHKFVTGGNLQTRCCCCCPDSRR